MSPELKKRIQLASAGQLETSVNELADQFLQYSAAHCAKGTLPSRRSRINKLINFLTEANIYDISELNNAVLEIFFEQCMLNGKASSVNAIRKTVKSFINWIEYFKEINTNVRVQAIALAKEGKRNFRYIRSEEIEKIINNRNISYIDRLLIAVGFMMGPRATEMSNIRIKDFTGDLLRIIGKGDAERNVVVPATISKMIEIYTQIAPYPLEPEDYLFQSLWRDEWHRMSSQTIWRRLKIVFVKFGHKEASPHWLRHSFAVDLLLKGCDLVTIQKSLGHTDIKITQKYLNVADDVLREQIHKFID